MFCFITDHTKSIENISDRLGIIQKIYDRHITILYSKLRYQSMYHHVTYNLLRGQIRLLNEQVNYNMRYIKYDYQLIATDKCALKNELNKVYPAFAKRIKSKYPHRLDVKYKQWCESKIDLHYELKVYYKIWHRLHNPIRKIPIVFVEHQYIMPTAAQVNSKTL